MVQFIVGLAVGAGMCLFVIALLCVGGDDR